MLFGEDVLNSGIVCDCCRKRAINVSQDISTRTPHMEDGRKEAFYARDESTAP